MRCKIVTYFLMLLSLLPYLTACNSMQVQNTNSFYITGHVKSTLMPTGYLTEKVTLAHIFTAEYKGDAYTLTSVLRLAPEEMVIAGFTDIGRLFTISYNADDIITAETSDLFVPEAFKPEYVLSDIQLIFYPKAALNENLPAEMSVKEYDDEVDYYRDFFAAGTRIISIKYDNADKYAANIDFTNLERGYAYRLELLEQ